MTFGEKLARLIEAKGWKAAEVARRLKVSPNTVGRWLADERRPFDDALLAVARLFDVRTDFLVDQAQDDPPTPALTADESMILRIVRASGLTADDVARALMRYVSTPPNSVTTTVIPGEGGAPRHSKRA